MECILQPGASIVTDTLPLPKVETMKHCLTLLALAGILIAPAAFAEEEADVKEDVAALAESNDAALNDLCSTYADEDGIETAKRAAYIKECMTSMTGLSDNMQEPLPLVSEGTDEAVATPMSEQVNNDPEQLVKSELVETPDPAAEQLDARKN